MDNGPAIAAIDCGTNSTRLLVVDEHGRALERLMRITRLGQGVDATGRLAPEAIERCVAVLSEFRSVMDDLGVVRGRLVATSAVRDAANGDEFLEAAGSAIGLTPELLSGLDEGRLSMAGAVADLDPAEGPFLVLDIGGGSTELVEGDGPDDPDLAAVSLQLGCVRLSERFFRSDPPTATQLAEAEAEVAAQLESAIAAHPRYLEARRLVGLAGTVSTLTSLDLEMVDYDRDRIHHAVLGAKDVEGWLHLLAAETRAERLGRPGMVPGREDVIVGGAMILDAVLRRFGFTDCLVSEADILDGMVASQLQG
ncbi:MAG: Ppx/GppA phosphatase family protein [Acidimicrobiales bacterium]|jgi:exopolyphosphatase/guanosine-5'-triphosphate,3'-diphosphate pyrophosphatase